MAWSVGVFQNDVTTWFERVRIRATRTNLMTMKYQETIDMNTSSPKTNSPMASVSRRKLAKLIVVRASVGCMASSLQSVNLNSIGTTVQARAGKPLRIAGTKTQSLMAVIAASSSAESPLDFARVISWGAP